MTTEHGLPVAIKQSDQKYCFSCAKIIHITAGTCPFCGAGQHGLALATTVSPNGLPLTAQQVFCRGCSTPLHAEAVACPKCGAPQARFVGEVPKTQKSRMTAALLAIFVGGIGIHKFYLGQPVLGILYLLFCLTLIPTFIAFIEGIIFLCQSDETFMKNHCS